MTWTREKSAASPASRTEKTDGMESAQCNGLAKPAAWKTRDGRLWFPTSKGLVMVDPKTIKINQTPPPVYIEQALADKKPLLRDGLAVNPSAPEDADPPVQIPPGRGELEFHYTALSFQTPEKSRFKYKLEGVESGLAGRGHAADRVLQQPASGKLSLSRDRLQQ